MKQPLWLLFGLASILTISGCSSTNGLGKEDSLFRNKALDYSQAASAERLQVPAGMQDERIKDDLLIIPEVDTSASKAGFKEAPRPDFVFAEMGSATAQLVGANTNQYIAVSGDMDKVWFNVSQFWQRQNMPLEVADQDLGIMETAWAPLPGVDQDPGVVGSWLRSLTGGDKDLAYSKVRTELKPNAAGRVAIHLSYMQASHADVASGLQPDWQAQATNVEAKSALMFELLQHLSRTVRVVNKSTQSNSAEVGLLGKDQYGRPLLSIEANQDQAMSLLLEAMADMDVGSYDQQAGKIYFTHTTNIEAKAEKSNGGGLWEWFKDLNTGGDDGQNTGITLDSSLFGGAKEPVEKQPEIIYSSQNTQPSVSDDPKDRKGFKVWLGGEVIYIFEDEDQGDINEEGIYTFTGYYQLTLTPTLKGVYVQVLTSKTEFAAKAHAEEILWQIKQAL